MEQQLSTRARVTFTAAFTVPSMGAAGAVVGLFASRSPGLASLGRGFAIGASLGVASALAGGMIREDATWDRVAPRASVASVALGAAAGAGLAGRFVQHPSPFARVGAGALGATIAGVAAVLGSTAVDMLRYELERKEYRARYE